MASCEVEETAELSAAVMEDVSRLLKQVKSAIELESSVSDGTVALSVCLSQYKDALQLVDAMLLSEEILNSPSLDEVLRQHKAVVESRVSHLLEAHMAVDSEDEDAKRESESDLVIDDNLIDELLRTAPKGSEIYNEALELARLREDMQRSQSQMEACEKLVLEAVDSKMAALTSLADGSHDDDDEDYALHDEDVAEQHSDDGVEANSEDDAFLQALATRIQQTVDSSSFTAELSEYRALVESQSAERSAADDFHFEMSDELLLAAATGDALNRATELPAMECGPLVEWTSSAPLFGVPKRSGLSEAVIAHIWTFLSARDSAKCALTVCKQWRNEFLGNPTLLKCVFRRIVIGADPLRVDLGHAISLKWLQPSATDSEGMDQCSILRRTVEQLILATGISTGDKLLDELDCAILYNGAVNPFPKLHTVICYSTRIPKAMRTLSALTSLKQLCIEEHVSLKQMLPMFPALEALSASAIDFDSASIGVFPRLRFLSFLFGVDSHNLAAIFKMFPNIEHLSLEFNELCYDFSFLVDSCPSLETIHLSLNLKTFWFLPGSQILTVREKHIRRWLYGIEVKRVILDRDYVLGAEVDCHKDDKLMVDILKLILDPATDISVCHGDCFFNLRVFAEFCHLF